MEEVIIKFGGIEIQNQKSSKHKELISTKYVDINRMVVSNKVCFDKKGFKYFICYKKVKKFYVMYIFPKNECI